MSKEIVILVNDQRELEGKVSTAYGMLKSALRAGAAEMVLRRPGRSLGQNRKMWPMLSDVARQQQLVIDGVAEWAQPEDWKDVFTNALRKHQRMAQGIDGGVVMLGMRTSRMRKQEFSDLIEVIYEYGARNGVQWSEPALAAYEECMEAQRNG